MSAPTLSVARLNARYRVASGGDERRQLDGVLRLMLDEALEPALARAEADVPGEQVCIRRVDAPVRLALARHGDGALAVSWADAIAAAICERLHGGGPDVARYGSRRHALLDMALCLVAGDRQREWAWRSMGVWPVGETEPTRALLRALVADGAATAPVLAGLARADALRGLVTRVAPSAWLELALAALCSAGASPSVAQRALAVGGRPARMPAAIARALGRSEIAAALATTGAPATAVAALALVEREPATVAALGERLAGALPARPTDTAQAAPTTDATSEGTDPDQVTEPDQTPAHASVVSSQDDPQPQLPGGPDARPDHAPAPPPDRERMIDDAHADVEVPSRARAPSAFGGLVFALHAVVALDVAGRFAAELPEVEQECALHALALAIAVEAEPGDAAALAFAGLAPDAPTPIWPPHDTAAAAVHAASRDVRSWLATRLDTDPAQLDLDALLHRRSEITADPGWIEFHLAFDEIDTAVRRAGLDLDPDHLPFLGCVVRIVYA